MGVRSGKLFFFTFWIALQVSLVAAVQKNPLNSHRILQVLSLNNPPFTNLKMGGIDTMILQSIADKLNLTIRLSTINSLDSISIEKIKKFDVLLGGLTSIQINSTNFVPTPVYLDNSISICVRQAPPFAKWLNIFLIVKDSQTWLYGFVLLFSAIALLFFLSAIEVNKFDIWASITLAIRVLSGSSTSYQPESFFFRVVYFSLTYCQLLLVTTYSAYYMSFVTRRIFEPQVTTIEEIVNLNYRVFVSNTGENYLNGHKMNQFEAISICGSIDGCLNRLQHENRMALLISRLLIETSNVPNIYCFDRSQDLHTYFNVFLLRSDLFIFVEFSEVFERIIASGLIPKWVKDLRVPNQQIDDTEAIEPFKLENAIGPFSICCPTLALAFIAAIVEQIISRQYTRNPNSRYWRLAHKLIDGKRYYCIWDWKQRVPLGNSS